MRAIFLVSLLGALSAVVRADSTYWVNPNIGQDLQQQRFVIDSTECVAMANRLIPERPRVDCYLLPLEQQGACMGSQAGQQLGEALGGTAQRREQGRVDYAKACMGSRGWQQRTE